jgi:large subunit ribosomal protein L20
MPRVKRGKTKNKKRNKVKKQTKGYRWGRKNKYRAAKQALLKAWSYKYRDRKTKKRNFRRKWQTQINAACRQNKTTYSKFIHNLKENNIELDRKVLADLAKNNPEVFSEIVKEVK